MSVKIEKIVKTFHKMIGQLDQLSQTNGAAIERLNLDIADLSAEKRQAESIKKALDNIVNPVL